MASNPGILSEWPWTPLGRFKYLVLAPWVVDSIYTTFLKKCTNDDRGVDMNYIFMFPLLVWRVIHCQIWISLSRFKTSKSKSRIVDKPIEFEQVDRENNWDDTIILQGILFYMVHKYVPLPGASYFPVWRTDGIVMTILLHMGPVEFFYYWFHRALHHHCLYSRYHSHHHSSIATEPITAVIHPFGEHLMYFIIFAIPLLTMVFTETVSMVSVFGYLTYVDFMNNMGHCNFEFVPPYLFTFFPPLKYIFYTPSYHSLHHTQFRTNYALFMPIYDYIYGTMDRSSDDLYKKSLRRQDESPHVVHLTHLATPESIYNLRIGLVSLSSEPYDNTFPCSKWYRIMIKGLLWPMNWIFNYSSTFVTERNSFNERGTGKATLSMQTWVVPRCSYHYTLPNQRGGINRLVEKAILDADNAGVKVLSLGLLNQGEELNGNGEAYIQKHPKLKIKVVDGSNLAAEIVVSIIIGIIQAARRTNLKTQQAVVMIKGKVTKVAYYSTPAMIIPPSLQNVDSCELIACKMYNKIWLPRRVMSAWRVAGMLHALEDWKWHESGNWSKEDVMIDKVWSASLHHGFRPYDLPVPA